MRLFTVIGPAQSGKSTLVAALAGLEGRAQRFEIADAAALTQFRYIDEDWAAIDIAGGPDTLGYAGPALAASDAVVLCVPAGADAAVLSAPYLRLIEEAGVPCFLFLNKIDASTDRVRDTVAALQTYSGHHIVLRQVPIREDGTVTGSVDLISERAWHYNEGKPSVLIELPIDVRPREEEARAELLESLSDFDDALLEQLIEDVRPAAQDVFPLTSRVAEGSDLVSAFMGAASHNNGITRLMKSLRHEAPGIEVTRARLGDGTLAIGALADIRKHIGKLVLLRALNEGVAAGQPLGGETIGSLTEIDARTPRTALEPGTVGLAVKSDHLAAGHAYSAKGEVETPSWAAARPAMMSLLVAPAHERDEVRLSTALHKIPEIDPGASVGQDALTGKAVLGVQGPLHLRRLTAKLADDFGIEVTHDPISPEYRETITKGVEVRHRHRKQSGGAGQFADVVVEVNPMPRGTGFGFDEVVKGGAVPRNYIPAVASGAGDALARGPHGFPVADVKVTLKDGKHHAVDSSDFAFRTAGAAAVREALTLAKPVLLQPILRVDVHVPSIFAGGLVPTVSSLGGQVLGFEGDPGAAGWDIFSATLPARALVDLTRSLGSSTRGTAWLRSAFERYEEVRGAEAERITEEARTEPA
ncbi:MAG: elongation factor G [Pseudomonadota bacterium]